MDKELKKFIKKTYPYWDSLPKDSKNKQNIIEAFEAGQSSATLLLKEIKGKLNKYCGKDTIFDEIYILIDEFLKGKIV